MCLDVFLLNYRAQYQASIQKEQLAAGLVQNTGLFFHT